MDQQEIFVRMGLATWNMQIARAEKVFNAFTEEDFYSKVAPGKNSVFYLYGHLASYHDALKEMLGLGKRSKPEYAVLFLQNPDGASDEYPSLEELKAYWASVHAELTALFSTLPGNEWFERHNAMTDDDFAKDPARNRLSVLLNRANHVAYHLGQVTLVKPSVQIYPTS
jgi:hypothetical protein